MADFPKDSLLGISIDILKTNTLKTQKTNTNRCRAFSEQVGPRTRFEDRFAKIVKMSSFSEWIVDLHETIA